MLTLNTTFTALLLQRFCRQILRGAKLIITLSDLRRESGFSEFELRQIVKTYPFQ
jgi:hypothetical protein